MQSFPKIFRSLKYYYSSYVYVKPKKGLILISNITLIYSRCFSFISKHEDSGSDSDEERNLASRSDI